MKLDARTALALTNLRASEDFRSFLTWLKENASAETMVCLEGEGPDLHRAQGRATTLHALISLVESAPSTLERFKNSSSK